MVETALMPASQPSAGTPAREHRRTPVLASLAGGLLIALIAALVISGSWPGFHGLVKFSTDGLVTVPPAQITRVDIRVGSDSVALRGDAGHWTIEGAGSPVTVPAEIASHIGAGLQFLHATEPTREIAAKELAATSFAEFGLDPPASVVVLGRDQGTVATVNFGILNPAGTSQYIRLGGAATIYLLPRYVGNEWKVANDMAQRLRQQSAPAVASRGGALLLPMSIAQVWAVEIIHGGKFTRFERDAAGNWFRHTGQHSHAFGANAHVADPVQAPIISAALQAFDQSVIETHVARGADAPALKRFGLALPPMIVIFYARDNSTPLTRLEFGAAADNFGRYARLAPDGDVVTVAEFEVKRLTDLLKAVGAGS